MFKGSSLHDGFANRFDGFGGSEGPSFCLSYKI